MNITLNLFYDGLINRNCAELILDTRLLMTHCIGLVKNKINKLLKVY